MQQGNAISVFSGSKMQTAMRCLALALVAPVLYLSSACAPSSNRSMGSPYSEWSRYNVVSGSYTSRMNEGTFPYANIGGGGVSWTTGNTYTTGMSRAEQRRDNNIRNANRVNYNIMRNAIRNMPRR